MVGAILIGLVATNAYSITPAQMQQTQAAVTSNAAPRFSTPSEAAYAASLRYSTLSTEEVGAKIYVDADGAGQYYSFGPRLYGETDPVETVDEIVYDDSVTDGHTAVVGLWHKHAMGSTWVDLYGHYDVIRQTHQTIWTTIGRDFFVQYFDGTTVEPAWTAAVPAIRPLCKSCA
jgi:hypothetical protein